MSLPMKMFDGERRSEGEVPGEHVTARLLPTELQGNQPLHGDHHRHREDYGPELLEDIACLFREGHRMRSVFRIVDGDERDIVR